MQKTSSLVLLLSLLLVSGCDQKDKPKNYYPSHGGFPIIFEPCAAGGLSLNDPNMIHMSKEHYDNYLINYNNYIKKLEQARLEVIDKANNTINNQIAENEILQNELNDLNKQIDDMENQAIISEIHIWLLYALKLIIILIIGGFTYFISKWLMTKTKFKGKLEKINQQQTEIIEQKLKLEKQQQQSAALKTQLENRLSSVHEEQIKANEKIHQSNEELKEILENTTSHRQNLNKLENIQIQKNAEINALNTEIAEKQALLKLLDNSLENG